MQRLTITKKIFILIVVNIIKIELFFATDSATNVFNKYFDKTVMDKETLLTNKDFQSLRLRRKKNLRIFFKNNDIEEEEKKINDSAMYDKNRFEGDIANPGLKSGNIHNFISNKKSEYIKNFTKTNYESLNKLLGVMHNAIRTTYLKWPNGEIPFTISEQYTASGREKLAEAIKEYNDRTCIKFIPKRPEDVDYIHIMPDKGCYSLVGKVGGKQPISIGDGCMKKGIILHELMHSVGFFHEQSILGRADRDNYIKIKWENVEEGLQDQFDKYPLSMIDDLGTEYDYNSIMHYGPHAFSGNGLPTIEPLKPYVQIGQRKGFSEIDLLKINKLYNCPNFGASFSSIDNYSQYNALQPKTMISTTINLIKSAENRNENCIDLREDCATLAAWGYCKLTLSSAYMTANCQKSCEYCIAINDNLPEYQSRCQDLRLWCPRWAGSGLCNFLVFQEYMHSKCALSCNVCK